MKFSKCVIARAEGVIPGKLYVSSPGPLVKPEDMFVRVIHNNGLPEQVGQ